MSPVWVLAGAYSLLPKIFIFYFFYFFVVMLVVYLFVIIHFLCLHWLVMY